MKALIVNDTHAAVVRSSGTLPQSAMALRQRVLDNFEDLLMEHTDKDIIHAGDILDSFDVPNRDMLDLYAVLYTWLETSGKRFIALRANHDWNPRGGKLSSWELLFEILSQQFGDQVVLVSDTLKHVEGNVYALGHVANSDLFEMEMEKALGLENSVLIAHSNYANNFAVDSVHSLNITEEWAKAFIARGNKLYCGHEHQKRVALGGSVVMLGSQDATSNAYCRGTNKKFAHILEEDGSLTPIQTMDVAAEFIQVDWQELATIGTQSFIRVTGQVPQSQAADVVTTIAKYRSRSDAFIITNAVKVEGIDNIEDFDGVSLEDIKAFDVRETLLELFERKEREVLEKVLED